MGDQRTEIIWRDGETPVAVQFDDPYYSLENGWAETAHVFLDGNALASRLRPGFQIAELGFGTGLNLLAVVDLVDRAPCPITFTSFEAFPMAAQDMAKALEAFPQARPWAGPMLDALRDGLTSWQMGQVCVELVLGDARETLPRWAGSADAWFLDGFSPAKNPELWEPELLAEVGRHTAQHGTCATYTAAGDVRRALDAAGFEVERRPGYGRKRHMTVGRLR